MTIGREPSAGPAPRERRVRVLPDDLANQIAAGEVVERPASVVKELVENALDAGSRKIQVDVAGGGVDLVRVADDGRGMDAMDAAAAVLRHATSKIESLHDLSQIASFGFRGEALPSIASVSRFTLRTRRSEDLEGTEVHVEGGGASTSAPCGAAPGTIVEVRDLFYNVPARRKFLRSLPTESGQITEILQAMALGAPGATITLRRDGRLAREWLRARDREERARAVIVGEELALCSGERGPLVVEALLSRPERARSGAVGLTLLVNGRVVKDRGLQRAVALAYGSLLEPGRYPIGVVYVDLPPSLVDVNVHPQKAEVRFADGRAAADAVYRILGAELTRAFGLSPHRFGIPGNKGKRDEQLSRDAQASDAAWTWQGGATASNLPNDTAEPALGSPPVDPAEPRSSAGLALGYAPIPRGNPMPVPYGTQADASSAMPPLPSPTGRDEGPQLAFRALHFLAQLRATFLLCEGPEGLVILDQHAAAERVTFHRLKKAYESRAVAQQSLLFPQIVNVTPAEVALVEDAAAAISAAGFDLRPAGPSQVAVHAVPQLLARATPDRLVRDLLSEISLAGERAFSRAIDLALATMACHGSLRAGERITAEEATALLATLDEVDFGGHCPHGRPIVTKVSYADLELRVGRR